MSVRHAEKPVILYPRHSAANQGRGINLTHAHLKNRIRKAPRGIDRSRIHSKICENLRAIRPTTPTRVGDRVNENLRVRHPPRIAHPGDQHRSPIGSAIPLVFRGEHHFHTPYVADSLDVGKRIGCVFRPQGRTNSGVNHAVSIRERTTHRRRIGSPIQRLRNVHRSADRLDLPRHRAPRQRALRPHREGHPLAAEPAPDQGQGRPHGKKTKVRVVPMANRVRALLEHHFALEKSFPVKTRHAQDIVKAVANCAGITQDVSPHVLRHTFATTACRRRRSISTSPTSTSRTSSGGSGDS
jgi:hypothetical protein